MTHLDERGIRVTGRPSVEGLVSPLNIDPEVTEHIINSCLVVGGQKTKNVPTTPLS